MWLCSNHIGGTQWHREDFNAPCRQNILFHPLWLEPRLAESIPSKRTLIGNSSSCRGSHPWSLWGLLGAADGLLAMKKM
jgi:hypothetical protein